MVYKLTIGRLSEGELLLSYVPLRFGRVSFCLPTMNWWLRWCSGGYLLPRQVA